MLHCDCVALAGLLCGNNKYSGVCFAFVFVTTTTESIAVLIRPSLHALYSLWVTESGKRIHNRLPSVTRLRKLNAEIFVIIIFLIGAHFVWVFLEERIKRVFGGTALGRQWCWG